MAEFKAEPWRPPRTPILGIESDVEAMQLKEEMNEELDAKNIFKDEWDDSDVFFIVEKTKFHVHRALLSFMSPVFKTMFSSDFREKAQQEIPLPGKKAKVFLSFLLILYSREDFDEVTMENVCDLLVLGDEYQVAKVTKECRKFLMYNKYDDQMAMKVLLLAQKYGLDDLRTESCKHLASIKVNELKNLDGFLDCDGNSMKDILLPQLEECQACLKDILPQLIGLLDFTLYLIMNTENQSGFKRCKQHYRLGSSCDKIGSEDRLRNCTVCQAMFMRIHKLGIQPYEFRPGCTYSTCSYKYGRNFHFDENIVNVVCKLMEILGTP